MDAKKGRVFATIISGDEVILEDSFIEFEDLLLKMKELEGSVSITADNVYIDNPQLLEYGDVFKENVLLEQVIVDSINEEDVISFAPDYLKLTDAEIQYNERNK
jgi:tRNA A37 threonylcarbamoyladenosine modification protein TsaB